MTDCVNRLLVFVQVRLYREDGQALVEYALIVSLIGLIAIGGITFAGRRVGQMFSDIGDLIP